MTTLDITGVPEDKVKYLQQLIESWRQEEGKNKRKGQEEASSNGQDKAWQEFFRIGDALAEGDAPGMKTLTSAVLEMRR